MEEGSEGEHDWLFDLMTEYLGSAEFNDAITDFVDEHCDLFKNEEENKLIHTDVHNEFKEHVEMLIISKLEGVSVPAAALVDACSAGRHTRGLNMEVFNRLVALDDFLHFKKMMVKRNAELELEALRGIQRHLEHRGREDQETARDEEEEQEEEDINNSILELDIMHRQEEIEQMALDQAIALSLSLSQRTTKDSSVKEPSSFGEKQLPAKSTTEPPKSVGSGDVPKPSHHHRAAEEDEASSQPKQPVHRRQPLPPIVDRRHHASAHAKQSHSDLVDGFDPAQLYADQLKAAERMLSQQRKALANDRETAQHLIQASAVDGSGDSGDGGGGCGGGNDSNITVAVVAPAKGEGLEARARHLRAVRDQLRAKRKQERQEELPTTGASQSQQPQAVNEQAARQQPALVTNATPEQQRKSGDPEPLDVSELRRQTVGMVLARRLKYDLLDAQQERLRELQEGHIQLLDKQVQLLTILREQSKRKEQELAQAVRRCQAQFGSNIARSHQLVLEDDELDIK